MSLKRIIKLFVVIILPAVVYNFTHSKNQNVYNTDRSKRFTLQDLFSGGHVATDTDTSSVNTGNTQSVDVQSLLNAIQTNQNRPVQNFHKPIDVDLEADKNGNYNMPDLSNLLNRNTVETPQADSSKSANNAIDINDLASLVSKQRNNDEQNLVKEEINLGKEKLEIEAAGKRATHYSLVKGADGQLNLVPVVDGAAQASGNKFEVLQPKAGTDEKGRSRQQMQLTTLSQALYSPFPSDQNSLNLHLKGKDGKDGKPGNKGPMGPLGPKGAAGPQGGKGDPGTCSAQVNGLFECTPEMLDTLSNRIDYLEKICQKKAPPPPFKPIGVAGTEGNPLPSCQAVYEKDPNSRSGPYWLMVNGVKFKTWCRFIKGGGDSSDDRPPLAGGWTLVARVKGQSTDWSPVSDLWSNDETLNEATAADKKATVSMKNVGWNLIKSNVLLLCFSGHDSHCAPMTHGKDTNLRKLFQDHYGVVVDEQYTMATFLKGIGKSCDLSKQRMSWCGLNLADVCNAKKANPNERPPKTTHIVRIGCIGDATPTCFPDDYAIGVGVTSCKDGFGCSNVGQSKNLHYRCDYVYGAFSQTAYIFVL